MYGKMRIPILNLRLRAGLVAATLCAPRHNTAPAQESHPSRIERGRPPVPSSALRGSARPGAPPDCR